MATAIPAATKITAPDLEGSTATHLQVRHEFQVVATEIYDALFASDADGFDANGDVGITNLTVAASTTLATGTHTAQTGDSYARLGAPAGASIAADILEIEGQTKIYTKNASASNIPFMMVDATDGYTPETGLTPTITRSIDGGAFSAKDASTSVTEIANGWYEIDAAAADMNGDTIIFRATDASARDSYIVIRTRTT